VVSHHDRHIRDPIALPASALIDSRASKGYLDLAHSSRTWRGARSPQGKKRVRQAARRNAVLQPRRSAAKTLVKKVQVTAVTGDAEATQTALIEAVSALDKAAKVGAIHPNAAARRKSRLMRKVNAALGGTATITTGKVNRQTSKAQATKAAKARIAAGKASKAKGEQTAAGKARAALSKSSRETTATATATEASAESTTATKAKATAAKTTRAKSTTTKTTASKTKAAPKASTKAADD
jgi:small subunit ribosomal protein S20